jgi:hypothetical protein
VKLKDAAQGLGVSVATLRRWVRQGAPCIQPGEVGRGHGAQVDLDEIRRWRTAELGLSTPAVDLMPKIGQAMQDLLRRDPGGDGRPAHEQLGVKRQTMEQILELFLQRLALNLRLPDSARHK